MAQEYAKIRFLLDPTDWHRSSAETVWAEPFSDGRRRGFKLLNSPFYARGVSYLDIVDVTLAPDKSALEYAGTIEKSGHSNIWLLVRSPPPARFDDCWASLRRLGCTYESSSEDTADCKRTLYAVDVPPEAHIERVFSIIGQAQDEDVWDLQIGHLAHETGFGQRIN